MGIPRGLGMLGLERGWALWSPASMGTTIGVADHSSTQLHTSTNNLAQVCTTLHQSTCSPHRYAEPCTCMQKRQKYKSPHGYT